MPKSIRKISKNLKIYSEAESFLINAGEGFYINSYCDNEPDSLIRTEPHRHTYFEIIFVKSGKGTHIIDFKEYPFCGPCLFLLHPQNIHTIFKEDETTGGVIKFTNTVFSEDWGQAEFMLRYTVFDDIDVMPVIPITKEESKKINKVFEDIYEEAQNRSSFSTSIILSYLKIFLLNIYKIKKSKFQPECLISNDFLRFTSIQRLIEINFKSHHDPFFYANKLNISVKTLGNITRKIGAQSPSSLIRNRIILEAKRLLHHDNLSVKEIAANLGYEDSSYFIRFFKSTLKLSPLQYKRKFAN